MKPKQTAFRHVRYRATGWIVNCFNISNIVYIAVILGMFAFVIVMQKIEDQKPILFFNNGVLPSESKLRRELIVTTAKIISRKKTIKPKKCEKTVLTTTKSTNSTIKKNKIIYTPQGLFLKRQKPVAKDTQNINLVPDIYRLKTEISKSIANKKESIPVDRWISVNRDKNKVLVYSAFWDDRFGSPNIRIMAILTTKRSPSVYCQVKMTDGKLVNVTATKKIMNEHWRLKYASYFVSCEMSKTSTPPTHVSLSTEVDHKVSVTLPIHFNKNDTVSPMGQMAVCVKPLHYSYDRAPWLMEFLELHRLLGVDHFFFYNHTVGENVELVLRQYIAEGVVSIMPWLINIKSQTEIRTEAIFSSLNDCLFRTMYRFKYVIMLDFDEFIIPRDHDNYVDMIEHLEKDIKSLRGKPGSFVFRNTFFYLYWENDTTVFGVAPEKAPDYLPYLLTQYKTRRLLSSMKPGSRSKYIIVPERVVEVGNHVVWRHTSGSRAINVPDTVALLHHYRICEFGGFSCLKKKSVVDQVATRFGPELLDRVRQKCRVIFRPDGQCPLSPPLGSPW